jgi:glycosyltransferase involved in cell wall biosynthesis
MGGIQVYAETLCRVMPDVVEPIFIGARADGAHPFRRAWQLIVDVMRFARRAGSTHTPIVHINTSLDRKSLLRDGMLLLISRLLGKRIILFIHGWTADLEAEIRKSWAPIFVWTVERADLICVLADRFAGALREFGVTVPINRETTFVDDALFRFHGSESPEKARGHQILFLSRALRSKGLFIALDVYRLLKPLHPDLVLVVAGDGPDRAEAEQMSRTLGLADVRFVGHVSADRKFELLTSSDLYIFPSSYGEGLPISLLEALAAGLPVVTTRAGGIADFFLDGAMGESVEDPDPGRMAEAAHNLLSSRTRMQTISEHNRAFALAHFTAKGAAQRMYARYQEICTRA